MYNFLILHCQSALYVMQQQRKRADGIFLNQTPRILMKLLPYNSTSKKKIYNVKINKIQEFEKK